MSDNGCFHSCRTSGSSHNGFVNVQEFQKALGSKQPVYDTTVRSGKAMRDKAQLPADTQKLDHLVGEVRDKWDTVCGKSVER